MYISIYDIGMTIGFLIAVTIGIYLIYVLRKIALILDDVKRILNVSEISLTETISLLPAVLENVNQIAASVKETASQANDVIDDVKVEWETLIIYAKAVVEIVRAIFFKGK
ncbi:hypothetical protein SAMN04490355_101697 [Pelosinus propionicus DSM 13327]|uniref:DUF948 domain-containing protein n=2 Tax=Pelosinus TaxID=365348 RepID=A0A1I4KB78_9FIRM|nr:hypothetical protein SAMN04490355_101697 [Pelosinus propionicus DSM 13327]